MGFTTTVVTIVTKWMPSRVRFNPLSCGKTSIANASWLIALQQIKTEEEKGRETQKLVLLVFISSK